MKIIFLDFDGVLDNFDEPQSLRTLSKSNVKILNVLVERSGAKIVVTSTWRMLYGIAGLRQILVNAGFKFPNTVIGKTPRGGRRGTEIDQWLKMNPGIERFVILDDDTDMEPFMDRLVRTDSDIGLTSEDVERAMLLMGK